jgi:hypothetical protein
MAMTLIVPADLATEWTRLYTFCYNAWEFARRARKNYTDPTGIAPAGDTITLEQVDPVVERANVEAVLAQFEMIKNEMSKVSDAISEYEFALNLLKDRAYRKPQLPSAIEGPHFDTVTLSTP